MDDSRHQRQLGALLGASTLTILGCLLARRSVKARRYIPGQFNANHIPPKFNLAKDAAKALVDATILSTGTFAVAGAATVWYMDLQSLEDLGNRMKKRFGGPTEVAIDEDDKEVEAVKSQWRSLFGKK